MTKQSQAIPSLDTIKIKIAEQKLYLFKDNRLVKVYPISTSRYGIGNKSGSNKTPLGLHRIVSKIGRNASRGSVFVKRRNTGRIVRIYKVRPKAAVSGDLITSRILRLEGLEKGVNRGKGKDSLQRNIYIHGTQEEWLIGRHASHGCIRMRNRDIIELFSLVKRSALVKVED